MMDESAAMAIETEDAVFVEVPLRGAERSAQFRLPPSDFVIFMSQINIVRNANLAAGRQASWSERAPMYVDLGNSRSPPHPFVFFCPNVI